MRYLRSQSTVVGCLLLLSSTAQWQQVPVPVTSALYSVDSYDAQRLCIGTSSSWLKTTDGGSTWVEEPIMDPLGFQLIGTAFYAMEYQSPTTLMGTGLFFYNTYPFEVRRSTDGGATWNTQYSIAGDGQFSSFNGMAFSGANGVAVGDLGRIIRTTNGGQTWGSTNSTGETLRDAAWPTATTAVVVGQGRILRSTNSGQTWSTVYTNSFELRAVSFASATVGFAAGTTSDLLRTNDGGATWNFVGTHLPEGMPTFTDLWFTSTTEGYATAGDLILHTTDGGLHWAWYDAGEQLWQLHFQSPTNGFAVAANGLLLRTAPGAYQPYALLDGPTNEVCHNVPTDFTDQSGPGLTRQWLVNGQPVSTDAVLSWTFTEPSQQDTVTLVVSNGTHSDTLERVVFVGATFAAVNNAMVLTDTVCSGQATTVQVATSQTLTSYRLYRGATAQGNAQAGNGNTLSFSTGAITADQLFHLVATRNLGNCGISVDTVSFTIVLGNPSPALTVTPGAVTLCVGDTIAIGVAGTQPNVSYQLRRNGIAFGTPQIGNTGVLEFEAGPNTSNGTYTVFATNTLNTCTSTLQQTVPVTVQVPTINWGATAFNPVVGTAVDLMNGSNTLEGTYAWTIPGGTPATSSEFEPQGVVFNAPGAYPVQLIGTTPQGCRDTLVQVVHVIAQPLPQDCGVSQLTLNGGNPADAAVALDAQGNMYGWISAENAPEFIAFSGGTDTLYEDLPYANDYQYNGALMKFDTYGVPQWVANFWHNSTWAEHGDVVVDEEGNVYTAYFHGDYLDSLRIVDAGGTRTTINPPHASSQQSVVVTSFTPQGRLRWVKTFLESYATEEVNMELDGLGHVLVQGTNRVVQYDRGTGAQVWLKSESYGFRDLTVTPNDHIWVTDRFDLVMREYANDGTLLQTTPNYTPTPPPTGLTRLNGWEAACDPAGNIYQLHNIQGQVIIGEDTLSGSGTSGSNQHYVYFFAKRGAAGEVLWTRTFEMSGAVRHLGMVVNGERMFLSVAFFGTDSLRMQGLDPLPVNAYDTWMLSYDLNGGSPQAVRIYDHAAASTYAMTIPGPNALALAPDGQQMALWAVFRLPLIAGTDTAYTYTGWSNPLPQGTQDHGLVYGTLGCLLPDLPVNTNAPQAYFAAPEATCAGQTMVFADASLYGPTEWAWEFPGGEPATSTLAMPEVTYALPGTYTATLTSTNANGESTPYTAEFVVSVCTGLTEGDGTPLWSVHPNPASTLFRLAGPDTGTRAARCMDLRGRVIWQGIVQAGRSIDATDWPAGVVFLEFNTTDGPQRMRLLVVH